MHKTFTQEDLVRFLYGEMNAEERMEMREAFQEDADLKAEFLALKETKESLDTARLSPSEMSVQNVMAYAKALSVKPSKHLSSIDIVLN
jgi:anti-sigma factor RsiW